jgi:hypothetical protein
VSATAGRQKLQNADLLQTIAEVAVAFVGFASLVSILGRRASSAPPELQAGRLRGMVQSGLVVIAFCFVPFIFHRFGVPEPLVWRLSSAGLAVAGIGVLRFGLGITRRLRADGLASAQHRRRTRVFIANVAAAEVVLSASILGVLHERAAAAYLTGLLAFLFLAGFLFAGVISSFLISDEG